jgi:DNA topoisomerase-1
LSPYIQCEIIPDVVQEKVKKTKNIKKKKEKENNNFKNTSIPKGISIDSIDLERAKFLCSLPKVIGQHPDTGLDITLNSGRFGPYLKCENKSARIETSEDIFTIGLNRAVAMIAEAKPGRISSSEIKNLGEHPVDKKLVRVMKGKFGPYIKYKSLNATIPEEKDPNEITMDDALILIEKRIEYDRNKKARKK